MVELLRRDITGLFRYAWLVYIERTQKQDENVVQYTNNMLRLYTVNLHTSTAAIFASPFD